MSGARGAPNAGVMRTIRPQQAPPSAVLVAELRNEEGDVSEVGRRQQRGPDTDTHGVACSEAAKAQQPLGDRAVVTTSEIDGAQGAVNREHAIEWVANLDADSIEVEPLNERGEPDRRASHVPHLGRRAPWRRSPRRRNSRCHPMSIRPRARGGRARNAGAQGPPLRMKCEALAMRG
jgi:hypothetical protein